MNELKSLPHVRQSRLEKSKIKASEEKFIYRYFLKSPEQRRKEAGVDNVKKVFYIHSFVNDAILVMFIVFSVSITAYFYASTQQSRIVEPTVPVNPNEIVHLELKSDFKINNR